MLNQRAVDIKQHKWFDGMAWEDLEQRRTAAPRKPKEADSSKRLKELVENEKKTAGKQPKESPEELTVGEGAAGALGVNGLGDRGLGVRGGGWGGRGGKCQVGVWRRLEEGRGWGRGGRTSGWWGRGLNMPPVEEGGTEGVQGDGDPWAARHRMGAMLTCWPSCVQSGPGSPHALSPFSHVCPSNAATLLCAGVRDGVCGLLSPARRPPCQPQRHSAAPVRQAAVARSAGRDRARARDPNERSIP